MGQIFVILAAGFGSRFNHLTFVIPKALMRFWDRPIIDFALENITNNLPKVNKTIIVTGHKKKLLEEYIGLVAHKFPFDLDCVSAPNYKKGNGKSLLAVESYVNDYFYLAMCDHIFEENLYHRISMESNNENDLSLCVDFDPIFDLQLGDATKVFTDREDNILQIGKDLSNWTAIDTGLFYLSPRIFKRLKQVSKRYVTVSDGVRQMIHNGDCVKGVEVSRSFWVDIDTFTDLRNAELQLTPYTNSLFSLQEAYSQETQSIRDFRDLRISRNPKEKVDL